MVSTKLDGQLDDLPKETKNSIFWKSSETPEIHRDGTSLCKKTHTQASSSNSSTAIVDTSRPRVLSHVLSPGTQKRSCVAASQLELHASNITLPDPAGRALPAKACFESSSCSDGHPDPKGCLLSSKIASRGGGLYLNRELAEKPNGQDAQTIVSPKKKLVSALEDISEALETTYQPSQEELSGMTTRRSLEALKTWYLRANELVEYRKGSGHCNVPQKYYPNPALGTWVNKVRQEKRNLDKGKENNLTQQKLDVLRAIGFAWADPKGDEGWEKRYKQLTAYKLQHGHCNVHARDAPLGRWVSQQRAAYKNGTLNHKRLEALERLGFRWTPRTV